ncbi:MAG: transcriptional regulator, partial [Candidatus Nitrosopelagicus sp.]|nr:transcriptional regulator [Candidatus Nitrosopelagicus sp.]
MPEIWLNYGKNEVVLDIMAENLDERIEFEKPVIDDSVINENLEGLDLSKPTEIVIQNYSESIQKTLDKIYEKCEIKSFSKPKLSVDKRNLPQVKANNPDTVSINEFEEQELSNSNLVFIGEAQFDGLFGYETVATRLLRKFGADKMIDAFSHRSGNTPNPGTDSPSMNDAKSFTDGFEVSCIEITANKKGISGLQVGHPSKTSSVAKELEKSTATFEEKFRTMIISTGRDTSNQTLSSSLNSIWNFYTSIKNQGLIILVAEC